ncbi:hypothetical protein ASD92_23740 [Massilia sp. Root1485]|nr:hypothetical protein ASD92_23740 [Massilia sp. Root1485]
MLREARAEQNKIKADGPDQVRWQIPIYSTSTKNPDLEMLITKSTKFSMRLEPAQGLLYFSTPNFNHAFKIDKPNTPAIFAQGTTARLSTLQTSTR